MFGGEYGVYVGAAYGATAVILAALIWATVSASIQARRELDEVDRRTSKERPGG